MTRGARRKQIIREDPDLALLEAMGGADSDALEELYRRRGPQILAYLQGRLGDRGLAEEVLQDVMLAAWRNASRFRGECRVYTWLLAIARNRASNAFHRQLSAACPTISSQDPDEERIAGILQDGGKPGGDADLQSALLTLSTEHREILDLVFYHGLSMEETAFVLKISPGTVKSRLHRAKARLREILDKPGGVE